MLHAIGDVHGNYDEYLKLIEGLDNTIQIGDFGFEYGVLKKVDPTKHIILPGNHENYDEIYRHYEHVLPGDYGLYEIDGVPFYYVRGAFSPDCLSRVRFQAINGYQTWWPQEQVPLEKHEEIIDDYAKVRPEIVITHDCPKSIVDIIAPYHADLTPYGWHKNFVSLTQLLLQRMFEVHPPKLWVFGHHHVSTEVVVSGTKFRCVGELETYQIK